MNAAQEVRSLSRLSALAAELGSQDNHSMDRLTAAFALLAAISWFLSAVGWVRVFNAKGDDLRFEAVRQLAPVMAFASLVSAAAAAAFVW